MKLTDIIDLTFTNSGEFIVGSLTDVLLDMDKFWGMTKMVLKDYQKYQPIAKKKVTSVSSFSVDLTDVTYGVPKWVSSVIPVGVPSSNPVVALQFMQAGGGLEPRPMLWEYRSPKLYTSEDGDMEVTSCFEYPFTITGSNPITEVDIPDITEEDKRFLDLVLGRFLIAVGRSRRAFTLTELPVQMDGSELVQEGTDILERVNEDMRENSKWYEALGV